MRLFQDEKLAEHTKHRLQELTGFDLSGFWAEAFADCPDADLALINLERWLHAASNPGTQLAHLAEAPRLAGFLIKLLGSGQSVADAIIQNPELASLVTDPEYVSILPTKDGILAEGRALLKASSSFHHSLDRLRYLKQRWRVPIVVGDLAKVWPPERVWEAISNLADAIVELSLETVWAEYARRKNVADQCPIMVVAFGKLGGRELNYSSDIDLVYVLHDEAGEELQTHATRCCEMLSRALSDTMGRGSLYRVDLRLRPFGASGPVLPTMRAIDVYYRSHAEIWEMQALVRSRPVCGLPEYWSRWRSLILRHCFKNRLSDYSFSAMRETRERIEQFSEEDDFKRGAGGIRDVEFLVQFLQMLHGASRPSVREPSTLGALRALAAAGVLDVDSATHLEEGYIFLRQLEHRCQLVNDQQTHSIPAGAEGKRHLAKLMGTHWHDLEREITFQRKRIRAIYLAGFVWAGEEKSPRDRILRSLPKREHASLAGWFDSLPEASEFYRSLAENEGSLDRSLRLIDLAPAQISELTRNVSLTEAILSGEIEEEFSLALPEFKPSDPAPFAVSARNSWLRSVVRWCFEPETNLGLALMSLSDRVLHKIAEAFDVQFDILALGSYGLTDLSVDSDLDLLFLVEDELNQDAAEDAAQRLWTGFDAMKRYGWRTSLDLRLRPEGGQGLLVRSHAGLKTYELERMEMWERFALGESRLVLGSQNSRDLAIRIAYAQPLTPENLKELVAMKQRIEKERVQPQLWKRDIKIGFGGLSDIEWLVHLYEMRYPTTLEVGKHVTVSERIRRMAQAQLINTVEWDQLTHARSHLLRTRNFLSLIGLTANVVPENPDKLDRLAKAMGKQNGYDFQKEHQNTIEAVRAIYEGGLERLGV